MILSCEQMPKGVSLVERPLPPAWVAACLQGGAESPIREVGTGLKLASRALGGFQLVSISAENAADCEPDELERLVREAYLAIAAELAATGGRSPLRFWNFIPRLLAPAGQGMDRYMVFNAGRFHAFADWRGVGRPISAIPAASGIGLVDQPLDVSGRLIVHCLAGDCDGLPVENPRQRPAYRYSQKYGPLPPCFARGTLLAAQSQSGEPSRAAQLLVSGTASVRGEDSTQIGNLTGQFGETLANLRSLIEQVAGGKAALPAQTGDPLGCLSHLRVYYVNESDRQTITGLILEAFPQAAGIELLRAELCRPGLLVEIEGLAELPGAAAGQMPEIA